MINLSFSKKAIKAIEIDFTSKNFQNQKQEKKTEKFSLKNERNKKNEFQDLYRFSETSSSEEGSRLAKIKEDSMEEDTLNITNESKGKIISFESPMAKILQKIKDDRTTVKKKPQKQFNAMVQTPVQLVNNNVINIQLGPEAIDKIYKLESQKKFLKKKKSQKKKKNNNIQKQKVFRGSKKIDKIRDSLSLKPPSEKQRASLVSRERMTITEKVDQLIKKVKTKNENLMKIIESKGLSECNYSNKSLRTSNFSAFHAQKKNIVSHKRKLGLHERSNSSLGLSRERSSSKITTNKFTSQRNSSTKNMRNCQQRYSTTNRDCSKKLFLSKSEFKLKKKRGLTPFNGEKKIKILEMPSKSKKDEIHSRMKKLRKIHTGKNKEKKISVSNFNLISDTGRDKMNPESKGNSRRKNKNVQRFSLKKKNEKIKTSFIAKKNNSFSKSKRRGSALDGKKKCFSSYFKKKKNSENLRNSLKSTKERPSSKRKKKSKRSRKPKVLTNLKFTIQNKTKNIFFRKSDHIPYFNSTAFKNPVRAERNTSVTENSIISSKNNFRKKPNIFENSKDGSNFSDYNQFEK